MISMSFLLGLAAAVVAAFLVGAVLYARWNYGVLEALNIPVVRTSLLLGSSPSLHKDVQHFEDIKRFQQYGPFFGAYEGRKPVVYICDPEIIRLVFVKDFDHFQDRREIDLGHPLVNEMLDFLPVDRWKVIRGGMSPVFTSGKMRTMSGPMKESIQNFCTFLHSQCKPNDNGSSFETNIRQNMDGLFMDLILKSAYGISIGDPQDPQNKIIQLFKDLMGQDAEFNFAYTLSMTFPILTRFAPTLNSDSATEIASTIRNVMDTRLKTHQTRGDFIDALNSMLSKVSTSSEYKNLGITETTVLAQGINFVLAGYDAMCTTMTCLLYNLAKHPQIQSKLLQEVDSFFEDNQVDSSSVSFDKLGDLPFLHACLNETLRLYPPFIRPERICTKDWTHKGLMITKGLLVMAPAWAVNRNPEVYADPDNFIPERFLPENKPSLNPYAFSTFGFGPRNCVGMKYALESMKLSLLFVLKDFSFQLLPQSKINFKPGVLFLVMYDPVYLKVVQREKENDKT